jgi:hypothetical protein
LNKIRFKNINEEVKEVLIERFIAYNPSTELWNTTFLTSLRKEARLLNQIVLDNILINSDSFVSFIDDFQNSQPVIITNDSTIFKNGTNMLRTIVYTPGAKVIFLINVILITKGISNRIISVIISVDIDGKVEAAFPTKNRIKVRAFNITLL